MLSKIITDKYHGDLVDLLIHMIEYTPDGLVTINDKHEIVMFNSGASRIFGYEPEEVLDGSIMNLIPEEDRILHTDGVKTFNDTHSAVCDDSEIPSSHRIQAMGKRKSGEEFPCEVMFSKIRFKGHVYFTAAIEDISLRVKHEKELAEQKINKRAELLLQATQE